MDLLTPELTEKLIENGAVEETEDAPVDHFPVVKFFTPDASATWLISEMMPRQEGDEYTYLFGLCDLGVGEPELGYVTLEELQGFTGQLGLKVERDVNFTATKPLSKYYEEARKEGAIVA